MRLFIACLCSLAATVLLPSAVAAQDPPPRIGPFVLDVQATVPKFPDSLQLANSRGVTPLELPGAGLGLHGGLHVYPLTWKAVTFGLGADVTLARSHERSRPTSETTSTRAVTEQFAHIAPELSFNFGTGDGWSYISGGIGPSVWSVVPDGLPASAANTERLRTINYGGGARWFVKHRLAFSVDARFYAVYPGTAELGRPGGPRTTLLIIGAGISVK